MSNIASIITIPAYNGVSKGLVVSLELKARPANSFQIQTVGPVAAALHKNFSRIIHVMSSLKPSWRLLKFMNYHLSCRHHLFVRDSKSAGMALCIALINVFRVRLGQSAVANLSGTGILRMDGSFFRSHFEEEKYQATQQALATIREFITPAQCKHIFELEQLIEEIHCR